MNRDARAELVRLGDELIEDVAATRRHFASARALLGDSPDAGADADHAAPPPGRPHTTNDVAELAALSMALMGSTREEARAHLRDDLGVTDPDAHLDRASEIWSDESPQSPRRRFARLRARR